MTEHILQQLSKRLKPYLSKLNYGGSTAPQVIQTRSILFTSMTGQIQVLEVSV